MGVTHCFAWLEEEQITTAFLRDLVSRVTSYGLTLYNVGCRTICKSPDIILATEGRGAALHKFKSFLRTLSICGIPVTTFTWEPEGVVWTTHKRQVSCTRFLEARSFISRDLWYLTHSHANRVSLLPF